MKIIIIGSLGSIGKVHQRNLKLLGYKYTTCDQAGPADYKELSEVPDISSYDLCIVCLPTELHLEALHRLNDNGARYILMEKPLCKLPTIYQMWPQELIIYRELKAKVFINHAYRFCSGLLKLKEMLDNKTVGNIRHVTIENSYAYHKLHKYPFDQYDGIIYDDSHIINTSRWLWGEPVDIWSKFIRRDIAQFTWLTDKDIIVSHSTDVFNERYKKRIEVKGEDGTIVWNFKEHNIWLCPADEQYDRVAIGYKFSDHIMEALKYVLSVVKSGKEFEQNTIEDAIKDMEAIECLIK